MRVTRGPEGWGFETLTAPPPPRLPQSVIGQLGRTEGELETGLGCFASGLRVVAKKGTDFGFLNMQIQPQNPKIGSSSLESKWVFLAS